MVARLMSSVCAASLTLTYVGYQEVCSSYCPFCIDMQILVESRKNIENALSRSSSLFLLFAKTQYIAQLRSYYKSGHMPAIDSLAAVPNKLFHACRLASHLFRLRSMAYVPAKPRRRAKLYAPMTENKSIAKEATAPGSGTRVGPSKRGAG